MHDRSDRGSPARPRRWRRPPLAALVATLAITLALAACAGADDKTGGVASLSGSGQPTATTNAGGSTDPKQAALEFAKCMRQHGIDMPDPKFDAAQQACQKFLPNGGQFKKPDAQELQKMVQFARCMRQHGIDVPDPGANGGIRIQGSGPDDPKFKAAQQACEHYLPGAGKGGTNTVTGGGSTKSGGDQ